MWRWADWGPHLFLTLSPRPFLRKGSWSRCSVMAAFFVEMGGLGSAPVSDPIPPPFPEERELVALLRNGGLFMWRWADWGPHLRDVGEND